MYTRIVLYKGGGSRKKQWLPIRQSNLPPSCCCHCLRLCKSCCFHLCFDFLFEVLIAFLFFILLLLQAEWAISNAVPSLLQYKVSKDPFFVVILNNLQIAQHFFEFSFRNKRPLWSTLPDCSRSVAWTIKCLTASQTTMGKNTDWLLIISYSHFSSSLLEYVLLHAYIRK